MRTRDVPRHVVVFSSADLDRLELRLDVGVHFRSRRCGQRRGIRTPQRRAPGEVCSDT